MCLKWSNQVWEKIEWILRGSLFMQDRKKIGESLFGQYSYEILLQLESSKRMDSTLVKFLSEELCKSEPQVPASHSGWSIPFIRQSWSARGFTMWPIWFQIPRFGGRLPISHYLKVQDQKESQFSNSNVINLDEVEIPEESSTHRRYLEKRVGQCFWNGWGQFQSLQKSGFIGEGARKFSTISNQLLRLVLFVSRYKDGIFPPLPMYLIFCNRGTLWGFFNCLTKYSRTQIKWFAPFRKRLWKEGL